MLDLSSNPTTGSISKETENNMSKDICIPLFMAGDFKTVKSNKQTNKEHNEVKVFINWFMDKESMICNHNRIGFSYSISKISSPHL